MQVYELGHLTSITKLVIVYINDNSCLAVKMLLFPSFNNLFFLQQIDFLSFLHILDLIQKHLNEFPFIWYTK